MAVRYLGQHQFSSENMPPQTLWTVFVKVVPGPAWTCSFLFLRAGNSGMGMTLTD